MLLSKITGASLEAERRTVGRTAYRVVFVTDKIVVQQQEAADMLHRLGLIPKTIEVRQAVWAAPTQ